MASDEDVDFEASPETLAEMGRQAPHGFVKKIIDLLRGIIFLIQDSLWKKKHTTTH